MVLQVSRKLGADPSLVRMVYGSYWKFIKEHIKTLPLEDMDEDDYYRLMSGNNKDCPYYQDNDEYKVVRHQI